MIRRYLIRYMILLAVLILCTGAVWYVQSAPVSSYEDAVLAYLGEADADSEMTLVYLEEAFI